MTLRLAADENFNADIVRGLLLQEPALDIVRIQEAGLTSARDEVILQWAADEGRILLTHDVATMTAYAYERVKLGLSMPGVWEVAFDIPIGTAISEILLLVECSLDGEWEGQVQYLPL